MKKKRVVKSILSVMLTIAMIFGTVQLPFAPESVVVHAEWSGTGDGTEGSPWQIGVGENVANVTAWLTNTENDNQILHVSGIGAMQDFDSGVPWNGSKGYITSVVIEDGVTGIGKKAFSNHSNLESVTIAESVTSIGRQAFFQCEMLTGINIPKNVGSIIFSM